MSNKSWKTWMAATRPWSFTASAFTVIVTLAYMEWAYGDVNGWNGLWAVASVVLFQAAGNTWSDWHDYRRGVDAADTHGADTLTSGRFTPAQILGLSLGLYAAAIASGIGLMLHTGWPLLWIGVSGLVMAVFYPALKYRAMGDVAINLNYSLLPALGTSYIAIGRIETSALWVVTPVGLLVSAILHANNARDMRTDARAKIRTSAHVFGVRGSVALYRCETLLPFAWAALLVPAGLSPVWALAVLLLLPMAWRNVLIMSRYKAETDAASIASLDQDSAQLQLFFSIVFTLSFLLDIWLR